VASLGAAEGFREKTLWVRIYKQKGKPPKPPISGSGEMGIKGGDCPVQPSWKKWLKSLGGKRSFFFVSRKVPNLRVSVGEGP